MRKPEDLKPGERVRFRGFRDMDAARVKGEVPIRTATFVRRLSYKRDLYEFRFDAGYTEHWREVNLLYALNGIDIPSTYAPGDTTPEKHVMELLTGSRQGIRRDQITLRQAKVGRAGQNGKGWMKKARAK